MMFDINRAGRGGAALEFGLVPPAPEPASTGTGQRRSAFGAVGVVAHPAVLTLGSDCQEGDSARIAGLADSWFRQRARVGPMLPTGMPSRELTCR